MGSEMEEEIQSLLERETEDKATPLQGPRHFLPHPASFLFLSKPDVSQAYIIVYKPGNTKSAATLP
jgi:hypothetical protein